MEPYNLFVLSFLPGLLAVLAVSYETSLLDHQQPCPAPSPCSCDGNRIFCDNVSLKEVPKFKMVNVTFSGWRLDISHNNITQIPSKAFANITLSSLQTSHNPLVYMADDAFYGSEESMDYLFMQFNKFTELPTAIGKLKNITMLSIHDNPMKTLRGDVLKNLTTVQFFDVGSPEMTIWPRDLRHMKAMYSVTFYRLPMQDLPDNAFAGLESFPLVLDFESTNFIRIPKALRVLAKMTDLMINDNIALTSDSFTEDTFKGMTSLRSLSINNSSMTYVPDLTQLLNLTDIDLSGCPISRWDENTVIENSSIIIVGLDDTKIDHIPAVVSKMKRLERISLFNSKVKELTDSNFAELSNLAVLTLSHSPVENISDHAFTDNKAMTYMMLDNLKISGFPEAISSLPAVKLLDLSNDTIDCSCATMGWMKHWTGLGHTWINGVCRNLGNMQIHTYLESDLPRCKN